MQQVKRVWFFFFLVGLVLVFPGLGNAQDDGAWEPICLSAIETTGLQVLVADNGAHYVLSSPLIVTNWAARRFDFFLKISPEVRAQLNHLGLNDAMPPLANMVQYKVTFRSSNPEKYPDKVYFLKSRDEGIRFLRDPYFQITVQTMILNLCGPEFYSPPVVHYYTTRR